MGIIDFILILLFIAAVFTVMIFLYARITRLLKKKSYHYIVPPVPENDKNWYPVDFSKFECYVFIKNPSEEFLKKKLVLFQFEWVNLQYIYRDSQEKAEHNVNSRFALL